MLRMLIMTALCLGLSGLVFANDLLVIAKDTQPLLSTEKITVAADNGVESATPAAEECYIALIPIYHIPAALLAQAFGGTSISFSPMQQMSNFPTQSMNPFQASGFSQQSYSGLSFQPGGYNPYGNGGIQSLSTGGVPATQTGAVGLNPQAPLAQFIPEGIGMILGIN